MTDRTIAQALAALEGREHLPERLRLERIDHLAVELRQASDVAPRDPRTVVLALKAIELVAVEVIHAAGVQATERTRRQAAAAGRARAAAAADVDVRAVRAWAREHGLEVPARGRFLPADVVAAYQAAQGPA